MGYTHYWNQKRNFTNPEWDVIADAAKKIVKAAKAKGILIGDSQGKRKPLINGECISLNGDAENGNDHETFYLRRQVRLSKQQPEESFEFCKTAEKPYDAVVVSILAVANTVAPGALELSSDGGDEVFVNHFKNWTPERKLKKEKFDAKTELAKLASNVIFIQHSDVYRQSEAVRALVDLARKSIAKLAEHK